MIHRAKLFNHLKNIDSSTISFVDKLSELTRKCYPKSSDLMSFDEKKYRNLYRQWGDMGIFNHTENEIRPLEYGLINYNIEKIDSALRSSYSVQSSLVINPIEKFGSPIIQNKYLNSLYNGTSIGAFGLTEPNSGSDPGSMTTKAEEHKDYYIVNGTKTWITNSPIADVFVIWCKNSSGQIIGLTTERTDGIHTPFIHDKLSLLASPTGQIILNDVKIPKENRLNVVGLKGPFHCLNKARYGISWGVVGAMEDILNTALTYADTRTQFNKKLNQFQLIQSDLVNCVQLFNNSLNNSFSSLNNVESFSDLEKNIAMISYLKKVNCENALIIARICRDILGGNGISIDYNIIRHLINLEAVNTYEGTKNIHNLIIGREITDSNAFT